MQPHRLAAQGSLLAVASLWLFIGLLSIEVPGASGSAAADERQFGAFAVRLGGLAVRAGHECSFVVVAGVHTCESPSIGTISCFPEAGMLSRSFAAITQWHVC